MCHSWCHHDGGQGQGLKGYIEDDARMTPEIRKTVNCSTKDDKITVNRDREQIDTNMVPCNTAHELVHGVKSMDHNASQELKFMGIPGNSLLPYKVVVWWYSDWEQSSYCWVGGSVLHNKGGSSVSFYLVNKLHPKMISESCVQWLEKFSVSLLEKHFQ